MKDKLLIIKNWILDSFQLITFGLLVFLIVIVLKQQNDLNLLRSDIELLYFSVNNIEYKLQEVEDVVINECDEIKRTVKIWSD